MIFYNLQTECHTILNLWKQRWLSSAGKIQTFKSLIPSKPVYIATMKGIPQEVLDNLQSIHNEFIWDGKRAKIKHSTLIGKYEEGGFKDVDLQSKFTSCKAIWIRKMVNNMNSHPWVAVANIILKDFGGANIFHTNLSLSPRMQTYLQNIPLFYKDLITWQTLSQGTYHDLEFILSQSIWNNYFIKSNHSTIFNSELQSKDIKTVFDLIDCQGNFSLWHPLAEKFSLSAVDFLEWYGILKCIPREWKNLVNDTSFTPETIELEQLSLYQHCVYIKDTFTDILKVKTNQIYDSLVQKKFQPPTAKANLSQKFDISDQLWPKIYTLASKCTIETKTRVFQYKILNNILYLNKQLYKMRLKESPLCSFCSEEEETFTHLFLVCTFSSKLWRDIQRTLRSKLTLLDLSERTIKLGFIDGESLSITENHTLLLYKRYIYISRIHGKSINLIGFKLFLKDVIRIEEKIAHNKDILMLHYQKWEVVREVLDM